MFESTLTCALVASIVALTQAATVTYNWNITWVNRNPDGLFDRPTIGINGQWPNPTIYATKGDRVVVNVVNQLGNATTSLHFHGIYQNGTTHMDGPTGVSQCPIPIGGSFTYDFEVNQPGTYWYHSHDKGQYPDGLRGPLVIHDPDNPYQDQIDDEIVLTVSDWYHTSVVDLLASFISVTNPTGAEPVPDSALMNDTQNLSVFVEPGKTYFVRIISMAGFAPQYLWFENHTMNIIEVDGIYTEPAEADMIYIAPAQRYGVLITTKNDTSTNFAIVGSMDEDLFDTVPDSLNPNVTGWLVYDQTKDLPTPLFVDEFDPFDDVTLVPQDGLELYDTVDHFITLNFEMGNLDDGANYAFINGQTYVTPKVPTLYSVLSTGVDAANASIYGTNTNAFILQKDEVVQIVLNSNDPGKHPFHLHGHAFQAVIRAEDNFGVYDPNNSTLPTQPPMRRDTLIVLPQSYIVLRFKADNPGVWLFHCHIEWHISSGLVATMIEAPLEVQSSLTIPPDHLAACSAQDIPVTGNAAANTVDHFDLTGENLPAPFIPAGFTARGIVAMVFSCISAFLGLAVISWYGVGEIGSSEVAAAQRTILDAGGNLNTRTGTITVGMRQAGAAT